MKKIINLALMVAVTCIFGHTKLSAQPVSPKGTYVYAVKDSVTLQMDFYDAAKGSSQTIDGKQKPAVIFVFGGGFMEGTRDHKSYHKWFQQLTQEGYKVFSIDYRLGLKGVTKMGVAQRDLLKKAINMAVEDLYSATSFIVANAAEFGIDPSMLVIAGSSAGAITCMQAEWELANNHPVAASLPQGFRYAGVMSFSGAIYSEQGAIRYKTAPAPTLMLHGTIDKIVVYNQIWFFNTRFAGANVLAKSFKKGGYNYNILRYEDHGHEIATSMSSTFPEQKRFLETNVMKGSMRVMDATIKDAESIPVWGKGSAKDLYAGRL